MRHLIMAALCVAGLAVASPAVAQAPQGTAPASATAAPYNGFFLVTNFSVTGADLDIAQMTQAMYNQARREAGLGRAVASNPGLQSLYASPSAFQNAFRQAYGLGDRVTITRREFAAFLQTQNGQQGIILPGFANGLEASRLATVRGRERAVTARVEQVRQQVAATPAPSASATSPAGRELAALSAQLVTLRERLSAAERELRNRQATGGVDMTSFNYFVEGVHQGLAQVDGQTAALVERLSAVERRTTALEGGVTALRGEVTTLTEGVDANKTNITALQGWRTATFWWLGGLTFTLLALMIGGVTYIVRHGKTQRAHRLADQKRMTEVEADAANLAAAVKNASDTATAAHARAEVAAEGVANLEAELKALQPFVLHYEGTAPTKEALAALAEGESLTASVRIVYADDAKPEGHAVVRFTRKGDHYHVVGLKRRDEHREYRAQYDLGIDPRNVIQAAMKHGRLQLSEHAVPMPAAA